MPALHLLLLRLRHPISLRLKRPNYPPAITVRVFRFLIPTMPTIPFKALFQFVRVFLILNAVLMMHGELIHRRRSPARELFVHFIIVNCTNFFQSVFKFPAVFLSDFFKISFDFLVFTFNSSALSCSNVHLSNRTPPLASTVATASQNVAKTPPPSCSRSYPRGHISKTCARSVSTSSPHYSSGHFCLCS